MQLKTILILLAFAALSTLTEFATFNIHTAWSEAPSVSLQEKARLLGQGYTRGNKEYEENKTHTRKIRISG